MADIYDITPSQFLANVFGTDTFADGEAVCCARPNPSGAPGFQHFALEPPYALADTLIGGVVPAYFAIGTIRKPAAGERVSRQATNWIATYLIVLDDIGTAKNSKVAPDLIKVPPSYKLETSPDNAQWGYFLSGGDGAADIEGFYQGLADAGLTDPSSLGRLRLMRLPGSRSMKEETRGFAARVTHWNPGLIYELKPLADKFGVKIVSGALKRAVPPRAAPPGTVDPAMTWLADQGMLLSEPNTSGWCDVECPRGAEHTDGRTAARYKPLGYGEDELARGFRCLHSHGGGFTVRGFLDWIAEQGGPMLDQDGAAEALAAASEAFRPFDEDEAGGVASSDEPEVPAAREGELQSLDQYSAARLLRASQALGRVDVSKLPDACFKTDRKTGLVDYAVPQRMTSRNMRAVREQLGVTVWRNQMTNGLELSMPDRVCVALKVPARTRWPIGEGANASVAQHIFVDALRLAHFTKLEALEQLYQLPVDYHPVSEWIVAAPWDGVSRFDEFVSTVVPQEGSRELWPKVARLWMNQLVDQMMGEQHGHAPRQHAYVLLFCGPSQIGKTTWAQRLFGPEGYSGNYPWVRLGVALDFRGSSRDSADRALRGAVTELSEVETTFRRADQEALKAFLSDIEDTYRYAYERSTVSRRRRTVFFATSNSDDPLQDLSGNLRFLPIHVERFEFNDTIDRQQLFAEVYHHWLEGEDFADMFRAFLPELAEAQEASRQQTFEEEAIEAELVAAARAQSEGIEVAWVPLNMTEVRKLICGQDWIRQSGGGGGRRWKHALEGRFEYAAKLSASTKTGIQHELRKVYRFPLVRTDMRSAAIEYRERAEWIIPRWQRPH